MSREALIDSLRAKAAEDAEAIWRDARADAEKCRREMAQSLERRREERQQAAAAVARRLDDEAAQHRAREMRMNAAIMLADRLQQVARSELPALRGDAPEQLFAALANELPDREWQRVTVNRADRDIARQRFPRAEIVCDEAVTGGMEVEAEQGRIRISNTLETRLATAWPDILPALIQDVLAQSHGHQPAT
jgi:vacuolar-type H+-ATPase subunit E/Vma4